MGFWGSVAEQSQTQEQKVEEQKVKDVGVGWYYAGKQDSQTLETYRDMLETEDVCILQVPDDSRKDLIMQLERIATLTGAALSLMGTIVKINGSVEAQEEALRYVQAITE